MAVVEHQLEGVLAGRLGTLEADVLLADLEDRLAVALHLGRRRVHAEELGAQVVVIVAVVQLEGLRCLVQLDGGRDVHRRGSG
ncbi:hypothetical protein D3C78_1648930 [compost metagenome]